MAATQEINPPNIIGLLRKAAITTFGALQNRGELLLVELQEEKNRVIELFIWVALICFTGIMFAVVFTGTIIFLVPEGSRVYAAGGFALFYLVVTVLGLLNLKSILKGATKEFSSTMEEFKKDREWLESLK